MERSHAEREYYVIDAYVRCERRHAEYERDGKHYRRMLSEEISFALNAKAKEGWIVISTEKEGEQWSSFLLERIKSKKEASEA